jgi:hypothetical protein
MLPIDKLLVVRLENFEIMGSQKKMGVVEMKVWGRLIKTFLLILKLCYVEEY